MAEEKPWLVWWELEGEEMLCLSMFATKAEAEAYCEGLEALAGRTPVGVEGRGGYTIDDSRLYFAPAEKAQEVI